MKGNVVVPAIGCGVRWTWSAAVVDVDGNSSTCLDRPLVATTVRRSATASDAFHVSSGTRCSPRPLVSAR